MIGTQPTRTDADTGEDLWCGFELPLALEQAQAILQRQYKSWRVLETLTKPWVTNEEFDGRRAGAAQHLPIVPRRHGFAALRPE